MRDDPTREILDSIRHIVRALRLASRTSQRDYDLSAAQLFVLRQLREGGSVSINELAEKTLTDQSSVSVVVKKLVERRLVSRRASPRDSRRAELSLTPLGRRALRSAPPSVQEGLVEALARMRPLERRSLAGLLSKLVSEAGYAEGRAPLLFEEPFPEASRGGSR